MQKRSKNVLKDITINDKPSLMLACALETGRAKRVRFTAPDIEGVICCPTEQSEEEMGEYILSQLRKKLKRRKNSADYILPDISTFRFETLIDDE